MARIKGFELLFRLEKDNFRSKEDVLVSAVHSYLTNCNFSCVGVGEQWPDDAANQPITEQLPENWNDNQNIYTFRYVNGTTKYLFKIVKSDTALLINMLDLGKDDVKGTTLNIEDHIGSTTDFQCALKNEAALMKRLEDIINPRKPEKAKNKKEDEVDPLRVPLTGRQYPIQTDPEWGDLRDPRGFGNSDLNPFGNPMAGGGMIFDPFGSARRPAFNPGAGLPGNRLPRGAVPPGARFDPFGPPTLPGFRGPTPDHFAPPPDYNDMFF